jgi:hypothetical protein
MTLIAIQRVGGKWAISLGCDVASDLPRISPKSIHLVHRQRSVHIILPDLVVYDRNIGFARFVPRKVAFSSLL